MRILNKISWISLISAILVVVIHVVHQSPLALSVLTRTAVPWFFLVSGYFVAREFTNGGGYGKIMRKRLRTLLVPYMMLNTLWFLLSIGTIAFFAAMNLVNGENSFTFVSFVKALGLDIRQTPIISALWYIRCLLIFLCIFSPLVLIMRRSHYISLAVTIIVFLLSTMYEYFHCEFWPLFGFNVRGLAFFFAGMHLWLWPICIRQYSLLSIVTLIGVLVFNYFDLIVPSIAATIVFIWTVIPDVNPPQWVREVTFPIYVFHQIVIFFVLPILHRVGCDNVAIRFVILFSFSIVLPIIIAYLLRKMFPRFTAILLGGR